MCVGEGFIRARIEIAKVLKHLPSEAEQIDSILFKAGMKTPQWAIEAFETSSRKVKNYLHICK